MIYTDNQRTLEALIYIRGQVIDILRDDPKLKPILTIIDALIGNVTGTA